MCGRVGTGIRFGIKAEDDARAARVAKQRPVQKFSNQREFRTEFSVDCKKLLEEKGLVRTDVDREKGALRFANCEEAR